MSQPFFRRFRRRKSDQWPLSDEFSGPDVPPKAPEKDFVRDVTRTPTLNLNSDMFDAVDGDAKANGTRPGQYQAPDDFGTISSGRASPPPAVRGGYGDTMRSPPATTQSKIKHSSALEYQESIDSMADSVAVDSGTATLSTVSSSSSPHTAVRDRGKGGGTAFRNSPASSHGSGSRSSANQFRATNMRNPASRRFHHPSVSSDGKQQLDEFDAPEHPGEAQAPTDTAFQPRSNADERIGKAIKDRIVVVTGCSSGIGLASSLNFLDSGWCVLGVDIQLPPKELDESGAFHFFQHDVTSKEAPKFIFESAKDRFNGRIDALVNCAGVVDTFKCVDKLDMDEWNWVMDTNLTAPVRLMGAMVKVFEEQKEGGSIVNIGSYASLSGGVGGVAMSASKHGLVGATKNTAFRFKAHNFRCNILCPGAVRSNIRDTVDPTQTDFEAAEVFKTVRDAANTEELRLQPEQVAGMVVFLASSASKGINGAVIPIDNGWSTI